MLERRPARRCMACLMGTAARKLQDTSQGTWPRTSPRTGPRIPNKHLRNCSTAWTSTLRLPENQPELASLKNGATAPGQLQNAPQQEEEEEGEKVSVKEAFASSSR